MNCFMHERDGIHRAAVQACEHCGKGICEDCSYGGVCYDYVAPGIEKEYKIAKSRWPRVLAALIIGGLWGLFVGIVDQSTTLAWLWGPPLGALGAFTLYMGFSWAYERITGRTSSNRSWSAGVGTVRYGPPTPEGTITNLFGLAVLVLLLFLLIIPISQIIGLFTGPGKMITDRKIIKNYEAGGLRYLFPNNYVPGAARAQVAEEPA